MSALKRVYQVLSALFVLGLLVGGLVAIVQGVNGLNQVHANLAQEHITVSNDAAHFAGKPVNNGETAQAQADIIWHHMLKASNGNTYATQESKTPEGKAVRATLQTGDSLRSALLTAVLAEKIAYLVIGLGVLFLAVGLLLGLRAVVRRHDTATA